MPTPAGKLTRFGRLCYNLTMRSKNKPDGQARPTFTEVARREQIIQCAIETIATGGLAQASLAQIARRAGISKGVISYYFTSKEMLLKQVVIDIFTAAAQAVTPQIVAQPDMTLMLQVYISSAVEYIGNHRMEMIALLDIVTHYRTAEGEPLFGAAFEEPILVDLESLLRKGQEDGVFRQFDPRVMAISIRRAIDAVAPLYAANPNLDVPAYARELATLFDRATRKA
jgi:TetR/AcrR family fatty acid metabolism transcriptional regulator